MLSARLTHCSSVSHTRDQAPRSAPGGGEEEEALERLESERKKTKKMSKSCSRDEKQLENLNRALVKCASIKKKKT